MTNQSDTQRPTPIRLSCRFELLPGDTVRERLEQAARYGFDAVSVPGRHLRDIREPLAACRNDYPLPLAALSLGFKGSLLSPDAAARRQCRESLLDLLGVCESLGIPLLNMPPVLLQDNPERICTADRFPTVRDRLDAMLLDQLPELGDEARNHGVQLLLEPVNQSESDYLHRVGHAADLCRRVAHPNIGLTADYYHMHAEESDIPRALGSAGEHLKLVHVAEAVTRMEPGSGSADFAPGFAALKSMGYGGFVELECRALSGPPDQALPATVRYLRDTWKHAGNGHSP
ncbi:MAG: sugar phosphate isomerase/epimerase family protein [Patescibacteria group bacterium]|nr:sugar phosphate isomerase/epimerase family protein [Patescibacteria group bacterium]